jgi:hypothetical protein
MIATDRFVFVQLHTCGGRFIEEFLTRFMPDARRIGYHVPRRLAPPGVATLPVLGLVRNPWSFYALWYDIQSRQSERNPLFRVLSEDGQLDFERTVRNMLELGGSGERLDALVAALPRGYTGSGTNLPGFALEPIRGSGLGFFSFLYRHMFDGPGIAHVRPLEHVQRELSSMLVAVGQPVSGAMRAFVHDAADRLVSHTDYAARYGSELRDLVAARDADLIARFGYRFGV